MATKMKLSLIASHPANPKAGDLCVWNMTDPPHKMDRYAVKDLDEAKSLIRRLVKQQLKDDSVGCNAFGLEVFVDGILEWEEWDNNEGDDIMVVIDAEDEKNDA